MTGSKSRTPTGRAHGNPVATDSGVARKQKVSSRYPKGVSGNPSGRPRGARGVGKSLKDILKEKITISKGGRRQHVSKYEAMINLFVNSAMKGDVKVGLRIVKIVPYADLQKALRRPARKMSKITPEEAKAAYLRLNLE